jgi:hypothetical protein
MLGDYRSQVLGEVLDILPISFILLLPRVLLDQVSALL